MAAHHDAALRILDLFKDLEANGVSVHDKRSEGIIVWGQDGCYELLDRETGEWEVVCAVCEFCRKPAVKWNPYNGVVQCHSCGAIPSRVVL